MRSEIPRRELGGNGSGTIALVPARAMASLMEASGSGQRGRGQVVELDHRIGLGPHADLAGVGEGLVLDADHLLAVEAHRQTIVLGFDAKLVPDPRLDRAPPALDGTPVALDGM